VKLLVNVTPDVTQLLGRRLSRRALIGRKNRHIRSSVLWPVVRSFFAPLFRSCLAHIICGGR
jgi:hypothetical protein